jgi:hypothetical protein
MYAPDVSRAADGWQAIQVQSRKITLAPVPGESVPFEEPVDERTFMAVLGETCRALEEDDVVYGLMGGLASAAFGRPRWTHDIDVFVRPDDGMRALVSLSRRGFATEETNPHWIYKSWKDGTLIDIIFRAKGDIYLDDEMQQRIVRTSLKGCPVRTIPPEDLIIIKAIIHDEETPRHWYDALSVIASPTIELDWDYLLRRATHSPRRVLSLLTYAQSADVVVPDRVIDALYSSIYPG